MAAMLKNIYEALIEAGASETKAGAAAEEVAGYENRLSQIDVRFEKVEAKLNLLAWMVTFVIGLCVVNLGLLLELALR